MERRWVSWVGRERGMMERTMTHPRPREVMSTTRERRQDKEVVPLLSIH